MKRISKKERERRIIYVIIVIILLAGAGLLISSSVSNVKHFRSYQKYIRNNTNLTIQPWMTTHTVIRRFNITEPVLFNVLGLEENQLNLRLTLNTVCNTHHLNCTSVIQQLDRMVMK